MTKTHDYVLQVSITGVGRKGMTVTFEPEWNEYITPIAIYNYRGTIGDGEMTMLLDFIRKHKLHTILEPTE